MSTHPRTSKGSASAGPRHWALLLLLASCARTALEVEPLPDVTTTSSGPVPTCDNRGEQIEFQFQVVFRNHCAETVWPGFGRVDGLDQSKADPDISSPLEPGVTRSSTVHSVVLVGIALWGRTGCTFDAQGKGHCQTGDCGAAICPTVVNQLPFDATLYDFEYGFRSGYNLPMSVDGTCCGVRECSSDLNSCPVDSRVFGETGVVACKAFCPNGGACCHYSNGCYGGGDVTVTFCP